MIHTETIAINTTLKCLRQSVPLVLHQGGTSSGKTFGILYALLSYLLYDRGKEKLTVSVVSENVPHLQRGAYKDFKTILAETELDGVIIENKTHKTFTLPSGTEIEFFSADNEGKARGAKRDILFVNEANNLKWDIYYQMSMRTNATVILDWNPSNEFWLHTKLYPNLKKGEYFFKVTTYRDNPGVTDKVKNEIERLKDIDPELYKVYGEGRKGSITGLIFQNVTFVDEFPKECRKVGYGLDFGFTNDPTALVRIGVLHGELYMEELIYETGLLNKDISDLLKELGLKRRDEIIADSAEPKSIAELRSYGWNVRPAKKGTDSVNHGISLLKSYKLNITKNSVNWRKEVNNYKWKVDNNGDTLNVPIDAYNHLWDAARYYASLKLVNSGFKILGAA